jgi:AAA ATPase domain
VQPASRTFVGRARELAELELGLDDALTGHGRLFLLSGEAGIGKTRLCDELAIRASDRGLRVRWGRCWEVGGAPAYWPWMQLLRTLLRDAQPHAPERHVRDVLARILPELAGSRTTPASDTRQSDSAEERFQLFDAVTSTLREAGEHAALLVILDDLHAADPSSLALLLFVARELRQLRICLVCTVRAREVSPSSDAREALARIAREAHSLEIARFTPDEVRALLHARSGEVDEHTLQSVYRATEGLPLFVSELARARPSAGDWTLPDTIRAVLASRVESLPGPVREVLEAAAVLGRETTRATLAALLAQSAAELQAQLSAAIAAGVSIEPEPGVIAFSHALLREAIYREITDDRRHQLHERAADLLERAHAAEAGLGEIANHLLAALPCVGAERALTGSLRAAERALGTFAFEDAIAILEHALTVLRAHAIPPRLHCEVLLVLGEAQIRAHHDGRPACLQAAQLARELGDANLLARAGLALGAEIWVGRVDPTLVSLLEESRRALPATPSALRARVIARLAGALQPAVDPLYPVALAREAIAMARELDDEPTLRTVLHGAGSAFVDYAPIDERLNVDSFTLALAEAARDWPLAFRARLRLFFDHLQCGNWAAAESNLQSCASLSDRLHQVARRGYVDLMRAVYADIHGEFAAADRHREAAYAVVDPEADELQRAPFTMHRFAHALLRHDHERLSSLLPLALIAAMPVRVGGPMQSIALALCAAREGRHEQAERLLSQVDLHAPSLKNELFSLSLVSDTCALSRLRGPAEIIEQHLRRFDDEMLCWNLFGFGVFGSVLGVRATLLGICERYAEAFDAFSIATDRLRQLDAEPALARTLYDHARTRVARGQAADLQQARSLLDEASSLAERLRMPALSSWIDGLRKQLAPAADGGEHRAASPRALDPLRAVAVSLVREGDVWRITHGARSFRLKHTRGLAMLAQLVEQPGRELHALALGTDGDPGELGDAGSVIDAKAGRAYRDRIEQLRDRERLAESLSDSEAAERARSEIEQIAQQLSAALGLGGKDRKAASAAERARVNVQRRIKDAIARIAREDAELGRYLTLCIRTGTFSIYQPVS